MAILGLPDTTNFDSDRFKNWRRTILYAFPNGDAPLTAFLSLCKSEDTNDPKIYWKEKSLPTQRTTLTASYTNVATVVNVTAAIARPGHIVMNELTGELMKITGVSNNGLQWTVVRGNWVTAAAASSGSADGITIVGNANAEGGRSPVSLYNAPSDVFNYIQIFRTPFEMTGTAMNTSLISDRKGPYRDRMTDALQQHACEMEKAFIFGEKAEYTNATTGKVERTTGGIISFLDSTNNIKTPSSNNLTQALWDSYLEVAFRVSMNRANEKLILAGSGFMANINTIFRGVGRIETVPGEDTFGIKVKRYESPHGTVFLKSHPLFTQHPVWRYWALIVDLGCLRYRYTQNRDMRKLVNRQLPDEDLRRDEFMTDCGLEVNHPEACFLIKDATGTA